MGLCFAVCDSFVIAVGGHEQVSINFCEQWHWGMTLGNDIGSVTLVALDRF
jgi:hypothetical protein